MVQTFISVKAISLQAWTGPEGCRRLRLPYFKIFDTWRWYGCQSYAPATFTPPPQKKHSWYSFMLESTPGPCGQMDYVNEKSQWHYRESNHDLPACSAPRTRECLSFVSVMFCQVEVSATGWSLVHRSPTECGVSDCDREAYITRWPWPTRGCCAMVKKWQNISMK
jgi:hypothetical protein